LRYRAVQADRHAHTVDAGAKRATASAATFARTQAAAGAAADTSAVTVSQRIGQRRCQRIAKGRHIGAWHFQIRRAEQRRIQAHDTAPGPSKSDARYLDIEANHIQKEMLGFCREIDHHSSGLLFKIKEQLDKLKSELKKKKQH
jgi:hypothetical protein